MLSDKHEAETIRNNFAVLETEEIWTDTEVDFFECKLCSYSTEYNNYFERHLKTHRTENMDSPFETDQDDEIETSSDRTSSNGRAVGLSQKKKVKKKKKKATEEKEENTPSCIQIKCYLCGIQFKTHRGLAIHYGRKHNHEPYFKCDLCPYQNSKKRDILMHTMSHTGDYPCVCEKCGRKFSKQSLLRKHMLRHEDVILHSLHCKMCDYSCDCTRAMKAHMAKHTGQKLYSCTKCGFRTNYWASLKKHNMHSMHTHDLNYKYKCDICVYGTDMQEHFLNHKKNEHLNQFVESPEEQSSSSQFVNKSHGQPSLEKLSELHEGDSHTVEMKDLPSKSGKESATLMKSHLKQHTDHEKSFTCTKYNFKTVHKKSVVYHILKHDSNYKYKCDIVNYGTYYRLQNHKTNERFMQFVETSEEHSSHDQSRLDKLSGCEDRSGTVATYQLLLVKYLPSESGQETGVSGHNSAASSQCDS